MSVELGSNAPRPLKFSLDGKKVAARPLPFRLFMELANVDNNEVSAEIMAKIVVQCAVYLDDQQPVFDSTDQVLDWDGKKVAALFNAIASEGPKTETARKNSKASQR